VQTDSSDSRGEDGSGGREEFKDESANAAVTGEEAAEAETRQITVSVVPADGLITLNGRPVGTGYYSGEHPEGSVLSFIVQRKGRIPQTLDFTVGERDINRTVTLALLPVELDLAITNGKLTGRLAAVQDRIIAADSNGVVTAVSIDGEIIWRVATANSPNENSFPVAVGNHVYFSGSKELVVINLATGAVEGRTQLDKSSAHLFGRRVVAASGQVFFPANESIKVIDSGSGSTVREIALPRGSRMTPAVWNEKLIIADQQGSLMIIDPASEEPIEADIATAAVQPVAMAPTVIENKAVFSGRKGTVVCVDLTDQRVLWEKRLPENSSVFADIEVNGNALFVYSKGSIYALSITDGADLFRITEATSVPLRSGGILYCGAGKSLNLRNSVDGSLLKTIPVSGTISVRPVTVSSKVIAGTENGHILVINP
jgi:outer membrane protein assembly factor BamB